MAIILSLTALLLTLSLALSSPLSVTTNNKVSISDSHIDNLSADTLTVTNAPYPALSDYVSLKTAFDGLLSYVQKSMGSCQEILAFRNEIGVDSPSGQYTISNNVDVYCDMLSDGGGWTLVGRGADATTQTNDAAGTPRTTIDTAEGAWHFSAAFINQVAGSELETYITVGKGSIDTSYTGQVDLDFGWYRVRKENSAMTFESMMHQYSPYNVTGYTTSVNSEACGVADLGPCWEPGEYNLCNQRAIDGSWVNTTRGMGLEGQYTHSNMNQHLRCSVQAGMRDGLLLFVR